MKQILAAAGTVPLGYQGESGAREIRFEKFTQDDGGQWQLLVQRCGDTAPYIAVTEERDRYVLWQPGGADTAKSGKGLCELRYTEGNSVTKSRVWQTETLPALGQETEPPPSAEAWTGQVINAARRVENALRTAPAISEETGNWLLWNVEAECCADSGLPARGEKGDRGDPGEPGSVQSVNGKSEAYLHLSAADLPCGQPDASSRQSGAIRLTPDSAGKTGIMEVTALYGKTEVSGGRIRGAYPAALRCTGASLLSPAGTASVPAGAALRLTGTYTGISCLYEDGSTETPVPDADGCFTPAGKAKITVSGAGPDTRLCVQGHETDGVYRLEETGVPVPAGFFPNGMHSIRMGRTPAEDEISGRTAMRRIAVKRLRDCTLLPSTVVENAWSVITGMESMPLPGSNNYIVSAVSSAGWTAINYNAFKSGTQDRVMSHRMRSNGTGLMFLDTRYAAFWQANDEEGLKEALGDTEVAWVMDDEYCETRELPGPLSLRVYTECGGTEELATQDGEGPVPDMAVRRYASLEDTLRQNGERVTRLIAALEEALGGTFTEGAQSTVFERNG